MKVWTVANQKGGVGKTTTVAALAGILSERGQRVLMLDCDPHASLTAYFGYDSENLPSTLFNWFSHTPTTPQQTLNTVIKLKEENISLMPASLSLATLDKRFSSKEGMGLVISKVLKLVTNEYDTVLIDCPPVLGILLINALAACQQLIIPVQTEFLAIKGLERMMNTLNMVIKAQHHSIGYTIVPTMFDRRTKASIQALRNMRDEFGGHLWNKIIPVDTKFRDASRQHKTPSFAYPETHGVLAYYKLADSLTALTASHKVA
ncbi:ParA family protein [Aliikangiella coralliicola]|uniref:ParA family protein n=1 Tax=Aliikangiella coralliicola TaxID=2592383 RepID=A0A545UB45_9GAMM|nr:ParA family protein [Aliikangiella coralliicola]TQV86689.1 ParA family protein [Aliikangiella coralliicola]